MVFLPSLLTAAMTAASFAGLASAHPHIKPGTIEYTKRANFQAKARRSLAGCQDELSKRGGLYERSQKRREAFAKKVRRTRDLRKPFVCCPGIMIIDTISRGGCALQTRS